MNHVRLVPFLFVLAFPAIAQYDAGVASDFPPCDLAELACGTSVDSQLSAADCLTACGEEAEYWSFRVFVQTSLATVTATSTAFDPRLELYDSTWTLLESNDGVGGTANARIARVLDPGNYLVSVVGQPAGAKGAYRISLHCLLSDRKNFCIPDDETLCLAGHFSFKVTATNRRDGKPVVALPRAQNELYGFFSFPSITGHPDNPEVFVKLIDGRNVNGHWWIFGGGLTDLDYTITVRDSFTRTEKDFHGQGSDTSTFAGP